MLTDVNVEVRFTNHERQSAVLFLAPEIHSKVTLYGASSRLYLLTLLLAFLQFRNHVSGYCHFYSDVGTL